MSEIMWQPSEADISKSNLTQFIKFVGERYGVYCPSYTELHAWSVQKFPQFWQAIWDFFKIESITEPTETCIPAKNWFNTRWFPGATFNFAQHLLHRGDSKLAIVARDEQGRRRTLTYAELKYAVRCLAASFRRDNVHAHDRVAAVLPNIPEAIMSMLAATSLGAIWSSCSPDFGEQSILDRFAQIEPKILITVDGYFYQGKYVNLLDKIEKISEKLLSIEKIIIIARLQGSAELRNIPKAESYESYTDWQDPPELAFTPLPFDHPIYILFSSGTTGLPKCIVHGAGGTLLQHLKELALHTNVTANDNFFYYTTCSWMMWNWFVSGLALGCTLILYDGSPFSPHRRTLFNLIDEENITVFGTSAKYISAIEKAKLIPKETHALNSLRTILSTGSPLLPENFEYVYNHIKSNLCLSSISGGTDIISCFALGNPNLPVYKGELQCLGLGMDVDVYDETGYSIQNQSGELVCKTAFPSRPIYFWKDAEHVKYQQAYFSKFAGVWAHGDYAALTERGTLIIYGRSDAVLNPGGVRIGTAEIYRQVEQFDEIIESLAIAQEWKNDVRIILFVVLRAALNLSAELITALKAAIKKNATAHHVPAKIIQVSDLPKTHNGKLVELAVRDLIHGRELKNKGSIANPEVLEQFKNIPELQVE